MPAAIIDLTTSGSLVQSNTNKDANGNIFQVLNIGNNITLTITSFQLSTSSSSNTFQTARTTIWSQGIGTCSNGEVGTNNTCSSNPEHRVDNNGRYEAVLFRFSAPVDVNSFTVAASCTSSWAGTTCLDTDATYWLADVAPNVNTLAGLTLANLTTTFGTSTNANFGSSTNTYRTANIAGTNFYDAFVLGARISTGSPDSNLDFFKIKSIDVTFDPRIPGSEVPEPTTYALIGGALLALGVYRNRRRA
jgi:hypothetical protein